MTGVVLEDMRNAAYELREAIDEHDRLCTEIPTLLKTHKRDYLKAHAASTHFHPERKVAEHVTAAEEACLDSWAELTTAEYGLKALKERMHSLRQILSAFQTQVRIEGNFAGQLEGPEARGETFRQTQARRDAIGSQADV